MKRIVLLIAVSVAFIGTGCDKSPDQGRRAELASANGLMPGAAPTYEEVYVVDQAQVKSAPKRTVSYEPLESFGGGKKAAPAEATEEETPNSKASDKKSAAPKAQKIATPKAAAPAKTPPAPVKSPAKPSSRSSGSFWKNVGTKALTGGGPPATGGNTAKPAPVEAGKGKSKADKDADADDDEEESDDEEKDSDEESDDSGKDDKKDNDGG